MKAATKFKQELKRYKRSAYVTVKKAALDKEGTPEARKQAKQLQGYWQKHQSSSAGFYNPKGKRTTKGKCLADSSNKTLKAQRQY